MEEKKEFEIVTHTVMNYLELFVVEMTSRCPHGHDDLEIGILLKGALCLFMDGKEYKLREGDIYIINRFQIHSFSSAGEKNLVLAFQVHSDFYRRICYQLIFCILIILLCRRESCMNRRGTCWFPALRFISARFPSVK